MDLYSYNGPVMVFNNCVSSSWKSQTRATSDKKAKSNLIYQYKTSNNLLPNTKVTLPGSIILEP